MPLASSARRLAGDQEVMESLARAVGRPEPFALHDAPFWNDPYIGSQMLAAHLDPNTEAASGRPDTIRATVDHLVRALDLGPGSRLLDLGCGPGLYASAFAERGIRVIGIDLSPGSIAYARDRAKCARVDIDYRVGDYTATELGGPYDAAVLIYLDFGVLPDDGRDRLLDAVRDALAPGGAFAFDVHTPARRRVPDGRIEVRRMEAGFWRPHPHLVLETSYRYDGQLDLDQYAVLDASGSTTYRVWDRAYSIAELRRLLARHGFFVTDRWSNLTGAQWQRTSPTVAVLARRASTGTAA